MKLCIHCDHYYQEQTTEKYEYTNKEVLVEMCDKSAVIKHNPVDGELATYREAISCIDFRHSWLGCGLWARHYTPYKETTDA